MAKFSGTQTRPKVTSPVKTAGPATTYEGGLGYERDAKSDLFLLAVTNMVSEQTFYETGPQRDQRFVALIHAVTKEDPEWIARFVPYLRDTMQMRSASVVMAAEYVKAGGRNGRKVVASALSRADEPAEILAYWVAAYGKQIPQPIKRGIADAIERLYHEKSALKYDGQSRAWRMGDVIELVHPKPKDEKQSKLFRYLLDVRHRGEATPDPSLRVLVARRALENQPLDKRRYLLNDPGVLAVAGMTWESLSGWLQGPMDAKAWEAVIPSMGYMALLRNLRNFDEAGIAKPVVAGIIRKLSDPVEVARSRQFPYRFWSAYKNAPSLRWDQALESALDLSTLNIPDLPGRTLVLLDVSGSMRGTMSNRSKVERCEVGALFGFSMLKRMATGTGVVDVVAFGNNSKNLDLSRSTSVLRGIDGVRRLIDKGTLGWGTYGHTALNNHFDGHDRVVIFTDDQMHDSGIRLPKVPIYTFNLAGYAYASMQSGEDDDRHSFAGFTDAGFRMIKMLEDHKSGNWPF